MLKRMSPKLAESATKMVFHQNPDLAKRYRDAGKEKCLQDTSYHLSYLIEAVACDSDALFSDYVLWAQQVLATRQLPVQDFHANLIALKEAVAQNLPIDQYVRVANHLNGALQLLEQNNNIRYVTTEAPLEPVAQQYLELLLSGQRAAATELILEQVNQGVTVKEIYLKVFQPVQHKIGRLWQTNKISVAQEHFCTAITQSIMSQLYPLIFGTERNGQKLIATCVSGDMHELGVRMVCDFFEMEGWDTYYLGANVPVTAIISAIRDQKPDLVLLSATMTFHVPAVKDTIKAIKETKGLEQVKILVGGYPFNTEKNLWKEVGANGYGTNAQEALQVAQNLLAQEK